MEYTSTIQIKPLSVNDAWKGQRFKTTKYKSFEKEMMLLLPKRKFPKGEISITIDFGFSSPLSDIDNPTKMVLDILQKKYDFNDKYIVELKLTKTLVPKGNEFIKIFAKATNE
jgi:Holliday junction resolvase RusA-like endonuclease